MDIDVAYVHFASFLRTPGWLNLSGLNVRYVPVYSLCKHRAENYFLSASQMPLQQPSQTLTCTKVGSLTRHPIRLLAHRDVCLLLLVVPLDWPGSLNNG